MKRINENRFWESVYKNEFATGRMGAMKGNVRERRKDVDILAVWEDRNIVCLK